MCEACGLGIAAAGFRADLVANKVRTHLLINHIGFELVGSMKLFQYKDTAMCIVVIIVMVMAADYASNRMRAWIQQGTRH